MKKIIMAISFAVLICAFCISIGAKDTYPESYVESEGSYTVYNSVQYQEVLTGIKDGTIDNKVVVLGCDIPCNFDLIMDKPMDITIDLNSFTLANTYVSNKSGDFDLQHEDAIIRVKNGKMTSSFCMFIFRNAGQVYGENVEIVSREECFYQYGGHKGVISLKDCSIDITGNYSSIALSSCGGKGGILYQIEGGRYDGLNIHCASDGSYVKDCVVYDRELFIDSWHSHGANGDVSVTLINVTSEQQIRLNDPRVDPILYDCTYPKLVLGGNQLIVEYKSPTCESAGVKIEYKGSATGTVDEQYSIENPSLRHLINMDALTKIEYESFFENGFYCSDCARCGKKNVQGERYAPALFYCNGYSVSTYGKAAIVVSFGVDFDAIELYESVMNVEIQYGVAVAISSLLKDNTLLDENGDATVLPQGNVIKTDLDRINRYFDLRVLGLTEEQKDLAFTMCAYMIVKNEREEKEIFYLQEEKIQNQLYSSVTYNQVKNK